MMFVLPNTNKEGPFMPRSCLRVVCFMVDIVC